MLQCKFKILEEGDVLHSFSDRRMVIKKKNGDYYIYKINGFSKGKPKFDKNFVLIITKGIGKIEYYDTNTEITASY
jgi:hypothetical protein